MKQKTQTINTVKLFIVSVCIIGALAVYYYAAQHNQDIRDKAASPAVEAKTYLPPNVPLTPPYVRLSVPQLLHKLTEEIPIGILVHTNNTPVSEVHALIHYDPEVLSISTNDIQNEQVFPTINIESVGDGRVSLSLFMTSDAGYAPIALAQDTLLATLRFHPVKSSSTTVQLDTNSPDSTSLFAPQNEHIRQFTNILRSTENISITIQ